VLTVGDLTAADLTHRLEGSGLRIRTGPVVTSIRSPLRAVREGIALHYAQHPIEPADQFADFHVHVGPPPGLRRVVRPQVFFHFEGNPSFQPLPRAQAFAMMEWGMNWCVHNNCHAYLMVHAAVVERGGRVMILPAPPGSGKSTLCAGLVSRGWRLLSDEMTLVDPASGQIVPVPRPVGLKNASIAVIRAFAPDAVLGPTVHDTNKGSVAHMKPPSDAVARGMDRARARWIVFPRYAAGEDARLTELSRAAGFMQLARNAFNYDLHGRHGFATLADVVDGCACYEFVYSDLDRATAIFAALAQEE
jgi:HprK-related kinase A